MNTISFMIVIIVIWFKSWTEELTFIFLSWYLIYPTFALMTAAFEVHELCKFVSNLMVMFSDMIWDA